MHDTPTTNDKYRIIAQAQILDMAVFPNVNIRRFRDAVFGLRRYGFVGELQGLSRFDLYDHKQAAFAGDEVDLSGFGFKPPL